MKRFLLLAVVLCVSTAALAQKADVSFVAGGSFVSDTDGAFLLPPPPGTTIPKLQYDHHLFLEGTLGVSMLNAHVAALYIELPVAGIPSQKLTLSTAPSAVIDHLSTVFVTPALRVKILPGSPISPWASIGGGWAHYSAKTSGTSESKAALQYGGGLDFKTGLPVLGFRAEVRDFVTGDPNVNVINLANTSGLHHHNVLVGGGIVLRF
jgi:opacity protein-like surface antigen